MTAYFITRHAGARDWAVGRGFSEVRMLAHLGEAELGGLGAGDVVLGTLPVQLAAEVTERGARYLHLVLDLPPEWRGRDLAADDMDRFGARLEEFRVQRIAPAD